MKITIEGLAKANADHFKKVADQHAAISKAYAAQAATAQKQVDATDDSDAGKALLVKTVELNTTLAASHKAISESALENSVVKDEVTPIAVVPVAKAAVAGAAGDAVIPVNGVDELLNKTVSNLVEKAFTSMSTDPKVAARIEEFLLQKVNDALGTKMVPTDVHAALPDGQLVPRPGQAALPVAANDVPPDFAFLGE
jgi:hypothetical protein